MMKPLEVIEKLKQLKLDKEQVDFFEDYIQSLEFVIKSYNDKIRDLATTENVDDAIQLAELKLKRLERITELKSKTLYLNEFKKRVEQNIEIKHNIVTEIEQNWYSKLEELKKNPQNKEFVDSIKENITQDEKIDLYLKICEYLRK